MRVRRARRRFAVAIVSSSLSVVGLAAVAPFSAHAAGPVSVLRPIRVLDSTRFGSPDPAGFHVHPLGGRIVVADAEAEERPHLRTNNLFVLDSAGVLEGAFSTLAHSNEPTGVTFVPVRGTSFLSDDDAFEVFEVEETFALVSSFSTAGFGIRDPEGIGYDPATDTLCLVSDASQAIARNTPDGRFLEHTDVRAFRMTAPQGVSPAPASDGSGRTSQNVADGRRDNVSDGWIVELVISNEVLEHGFDSLAPIADAHVESGRAAGTNFGASSFFAVDSSPARAAYLRVNLAGAAGEIASATLFLSCVDGSSRGSRSGTADARQFSSIASGKLSGSR